MCILCLSPGAPWLVGAALAAMGATTKRRGPSRASPRPRKNGDVIVFHAQPRRGRAVRLRGVAATGFTHSLRAGPAPRGRRFSWSRSARGLLVGLYRRCAALQLVNTANSNYSLYSSGITKQNFLRGVQVSDASGLVSFTTIFPGCYWGRWPHIHFEVYRSLALATDNVFSNDGAAYQLATVTGSLSAGYLATLTVGVQA